MVDGFAIDLGDGGDVLGGLEAAFDFEAADAERDELGDLLDGGEILRGEQVAFVAEVAEFTIDDHLIGHTAGLGAFAAVGAAATERFGGEALAGVGDAEGTVDEDFEREFGVVGGVEALELAQGELAGEHGLVDAQALGEGQPLGRGDGHLGGGVQPKARGDSFDEFSQAKVLNDDGIDARFLKEAELGFCGGEFGGEDEGVEGDVAFHAVRVEEGHQGGEVVGGKVVGPQAGVELGHAEVDGVGPVGDGGASAVPVAGGGEQFGDEEHILEG